MQALSREMIDRVIDQHFEFERRDDVEGVLATLKPDAVHDTVGLPDGPLSGREQARGFYKQLFSDLKQERVDTTRRYYGSDFVVDESFWQGRAVGNPLGIPGGNRPLSFRILHVFELEPDGMIRRENVWLDFASIMRQLGGPATG